MNKFLAILIMGFFFLWGCAVQPKQDLNETYLEGVETILVMPFQRLHTVYGEKTAIECKFCRRPHAIEAVSEEAAEFMTEHLINLLLDDKAYRFIFSDKAEHVEARWPLEKEAKDHMGDLVAEFKNTPATDAVLLGYLFRFRERIGKSYSVESPASVSFSLFLVRRDNGRLIWRSHFEETQQSLFENLLTMGAFFRRKARWITARELAAEGLEDMLSTFPEP